MKGEKTVVYALLFLLTCGALKWGYAYTLAFFAVVIGYQLYKRHDISMGYLQKSEIWLLLIFGVLYTVGAGANFDHIQNYIVMPVFAYITGWTCVETDFSTNKDICEINQTRYKNYILALTLGFGLYVSLNFFINQGTGRYLLEDFWSGEFKSATGSGCLNTFIVSLIVYSFVFEKRKKVKAVLMTITVISVMYMFILATRTQFVILSVSLVISIFFYLKEKHGVSGAVKAIIIILLIVVAGIGVYYYNLFGLKDIINGTNIASRIMERKGLEESDQIRTEGFISGVKGVFEHPLGLGQGEFYRHNMWLDIGRVSGIIPFAVMIAYSIKTFIHAYRLFKYKMLDTGLRYMIILIYIGVSLNFFVEPVLEGLISFFLVFMLVNGMTDCFYYHCVDIAKRKTILERSRSI